MSRFSETLQRTRERLAIPQPARSRVLFEIAADMEDLYRFHRDRGLAESEAEQRAVEEFDLSDSALAELVRVHSGAWRRWQDAVAIGTRSRFERGIMLVMTIVVLALSMRVVLGGNFFGAAGPQALPVIALCVLSLSMGGAKLYQLYLKQDHDPRRIRRGLGWILSLALLQVVFAFAGNWIALFAANLRLITATENLGPEFIGWLTACAATFMIAFTGAIMSGLLWHIAAVKVAQIEDQENALIENL